MNRIPQLENVSFSADPSKMFAKTRAELPQEQKDSIINQTCEEQKKLLEEKLLEWFVINNEEEFKSWINLLRINEIIDIKISFKEINNWYPISIKKIWATINILWASSITWLFPNWPFWKLWIFDNNWKFHITPIPEIRKTKKELIWSASIHQFTQECKASEPILSTPEKEKQETIQKETHEEYKIKKWDYLWKIISEKYSLRPERDKNAIWQIMEEIRKDPRNKAAIKDIDTIYKWKTLYLPKIIKIPQWKWKEDKEILLKEKEAK